MGFLTTSLAFLSALVLLAFASAAPSNYPFLIGAGIGDVTGPAAEVGMMGYVQFAQTTNGIHYRLRARAFVFVDKANGARVAFVNLDVCFSTSAVKTKVLQQLQTIFPGVYTDSNLMIAATHTHAGPGGFSWYSMYLLSTFGFQFDNRNAIVGGIVRAMKKAHANVRSAQILMTQGELVNPQTNINRSPTAYANNPVEERMKYQFNVDKTMTLLKFVDENNVNIGTLNWFAVHGTSMNNMNRYISGDNKGYAGYLFERMMNGNGSLPGEGPFVAAFAQTNEGDVSPNTKGAFCNNGLPCDYAHSTCGGTSSGCHGYGPGKTDLESNLIIGQQQFQFATKLFSAASTPIAGGVTSFIHTYVNMTSVTVAPEYTGLKTPVTTCVGAIGDATAAGTTDGPGDFNFKQGTNTSNPNAWWDYIGNFIKEPPKDQIICQTPKPILVWAGGIKTPAAWVADVLPLQMFRLGDLYIVAVPAEFTTMSGRRLRQTVLDSIIARGGSSSSTVVIAGLANDYAQYVATPEEFQVQRYEGSSTLFGPYTLPAYQQEYAKLTAALLGGPPLAPAPTPYNWEPNMHLLQPGVIIDGGKIGSLVLDASPSYRIGSAVVVKFVTGNPRNNYHDEGTYLTVEIQNGSSWTIIANDGNVETFYRWERHDIYQSHAIITWNIPPETRPGTYRIGHFGDSKSFPTSKPKPFSAYSRTFTVA